MKARILVVEDSMTQALRAQLVLTEAGYEVALAENGQVGLDQVRAGPPDLVVADIVMPVMNGYEMTRRLKSDPRTAQVPVLMLTTKGEPLDIVRGLEAGADHFMTKPYDGGELVSRVGTLFEQQQQALAGESPTQQVIDRFHQEIVVTKSREQILEALFQAMAQVLACEAMGLLLYVQEQWLYFAMSIYHQPPEMLDSQAEVMVDVLSKLRSKAPETTQVRMVQIVVGEGQPRPEAHPLASFMHAPLIVDGEPLGMVAVFSSAYGAFDVENVQFVFTMGHQAAQALSRLRLE